MNSIACTFVSLKEKNFSITEGKKPVKELFLWKYNSLNPKVSHCGVGLLSLL